MTEFLATFQVAYPTPSVVTGLKPCALFWWAFSPQTADDSDIAGRVAGRTRFGEASVQAQLQKGMGPAIFSSRIVRSRGFR